MATFLENEINTTEGDITGPTAHVQIMFPLWWPNTVFACTFANAIQRAHKDCKKQTWRQ